MAKFSKILASLKAEQGRVRRDLQKLDGAIAALESLERKRPRNRRRKLSAAARGKIAAAQRARWAKHKAGLRAQRTTVKVAVHRTKRRNGGSWGGPLRKG